MSETTPSPSTSPSAVPPAMRARRAGRRLRFGALLAALACSGSASADAILHAFNWPYATVEARAAQIQSAGYLAGFDDSRVVHGSLAERKFVKLYARKGRLVGAVAFGEPRRLIGYRRALRTPPTWDEALAQAQE